MRMVCPGSRTATVSRAEAIVITSARLINFSLVTVTEILHPRQSGVETWITSDGRAYLVQLYDGVGRTSAGSAKDSRRVSRHVIHYGYAATQTAQDSRSEKLRYSVDSDSSQPGSAWQGTCIHDVEPPKWVQKRKLISPDGPDGDKYHWEEPRRAVAVAINTKFSVVAIGMHGYASAYAMHKNYLTIVIGEPWNS